jgi:hypothetical protein
MQAGPGEKKPNRHACAVHATTRRLQALLHFRPDQRVKGRTAMQAACNRAKWARPFDSNEPSMEAQAHASCNRHAGCYVRATAPPLAPPRLRSQYRDSRQPCSASQARRSNAVKNGPAVMAVTGGQEQRSRRQPNLRPIQGQRGSPLSRREDGAPMIRSSNDTHTRNDRLANHSPRRINSAAGQAAPQAGEASDASPSP